MTLKRSTELYSPSETFGLRINVCEKPLSTIVRATEVKKVSMAITPKSAGIRARATTMLTTICMTIDNSFSVKLHATPDATLCSNFTLLSTV